MTDISKITNQEFQDKIDSLSERIQAVLTSEEMDAKLEEISEKYDFLDELNEPDALLQITLLLATGLIKRDEFAEQIEAYTYRNKDEASEIAEEILKILGPALPISPVGQFQIKSNFDQPLPKPQPLTVNPNPPIARPAINLEPTPSAPIVNRNAPVQSEPLKDFATELPQESEGPTIGNLRPITIKPAEVKSDVKPVEELKINTPSPLETSLGGRTSLSQASTSETNNNIAPAPFIIHEHTEQKPLSQNFGQNQIGGTYIKPGFTINPSPVQKESNPFSQQSVTAKVDFGRGIYSFGEGQPPKTTESQNIRRIDYSTPKIDATKPKPPVDIHPDNVIDLKDLPK